MSDIDEVHYWSPLDWAHAQQEGGGERKGGKKAASWEAPPDIEIGGDKLTSREEGPEDIQEKGGEESPAASQEFSSDGVFQNTKQQSSRNYASAPPVWMLHHDQVHSEKEGREDVMSPGALKKAFTNSDEEAQRETAAQNASRRFVSAPIACMGHHDQVHVGAVAVAGPNSGEEFDLETALTDDQVDDSVGSPIRAELVDRAAEEQQVRQQIALSLRREHAKAPIAEVVEETFCDRRRGVIALLVMAILAIIGISLGVTLSEDKGPPPAPVPTEGEIIDILSTVSSDNGTALRTTGSPQNQALLWLTNDTFQGYYTDYKLIQRYALATLFYSTSGAGWFNQSLWLDDGDECGRWWQFIGVVSCNDTSGGIASLSLSKNNLKGTIPAEIGLLTSLMGLGLSGNDLAGTFPRAIGDLTSLESLNLKSASLSGSIPTELANAIHLKSVNLGDNQLTGTFVEHLGNLTEMEELLLYSNRLSGKFPENISRLTNLKVLNLRKNEVTGSIPEGIGDLSLLTALTLQENLLTSTIPSQLGLLTRMATLSLRDNRLGGTIPSDLGRLTLLTELNLRLQTDPGTLTGSIPSQISNLSHLESWNLRTNNLTGPLPSDIGTMSNLVMVYLNDNALTGPIPSEISKLTRLEAINIRTNKLQGQIPPLGSLTVLREFSAWENDFDGTFPIDLKKLSSLKSFSVSENRIGGNLPESIGELTRMEIFHIRQNYMTGTLPSEIGLMTMLRELNARDNLMNGTIPIEIFRLASMEALNLGNTDNDSGNSFRSTLPTDIGFMTKLEGVWLNNIQLYGTIPSNIGRLANLNSLWLQGNTLSGTIPPLFHNMTALDNELFLFDNNWIGSFSCPAFVGACLISCDDLLDDACRTL